MTLNFSYTLSYTWQMLNCMDLVLVGLFDVNSDDASHHKINLSSPMKDFKALKIMTSRLFYYAFNVYQTLEFE